MPVPVGYKVIHTETANTTPKSDTTPIRVKVKIPPSKNMIAFLKLIRYAEHKTDSDNVYYVLFGGKETFSNTSTHPNKLISAWGTKSTAAGAYQILKRSYDDAVKRGYMSDFKPASQDSYAINRIKQRKANVAIDEGDLDTAIGKLNTEWVSLPGGSQSHMAMETAKERFQRYGGTLKEK